MTLIQLFAEAAGPAFQQRGNGFGFGFGSPTHGQLESEDQDVHPFYFLKTVASLPEESRVVIF